MLMVYRAMRLFACLKQYLLPLVAKIHHCSFKEYVDFLEPINVLIVCFNNACLKSMH